jgi:hypothetical protein
MSLAGVTASAVSTALESSEALTSCLQGPTAVTIPDPTPTDVTDSSVIGAEALSSIRKAGKSGALDVMAAGKKKPEFNHWRDDMARKLATAAGFTNGDQRIACSPEWKFEGNTATLLQFENAVKKLVDNQWDTEARRTNPVALVKKNVRENVRRNGIRDLAVSTEGELRMIIIDSKPAFLLLGKTVDGETITVTASNKTDKFSVGVVNVTFVDVKGAPVEMNGKWHSPFNVADGFLAENVFKVVKIAGESTLYPIYCFNFTTLTAPSLPS